MPHPVRKYGPILNPLPADHIKVAWQHLANEYARLERRLEQDESLVATVYLSGGYQVVAEKFGYAGPNFLVVRGELGGNKVTLYVHQSCLQVVFSVVRNDPERPKQRIGFVTDLEPAESEGTDEAPR